MNVSDFYFVDGGHSEATIENDGNQVLAKMSYNQNAIAIFDDYYHEGKPEGMGCNNFIDRLNLAEYEVTHLPARTTAADGRVIGMVKVRKVNHANVSVQMSESTRAGNNSSYSGFVTLPDLYKMRNDNAQSTAGV